MAVGSQGTSRSSALILERSSFSSSFAFRTFLIILVRAHVVLPLNEEGLGEDGCVCACAETSFNRRSSNEHKAGVCTFFLSLLLFNRRASISSLHAFTCG